MHESWGAFLFIFDPGDDSWLDARGRKELARSDKQTMLSPIWETRKPAREGGGRGRENNNKKDKKKSQGLR